MQISVALTGKEEKRKKKVVIPEDRSKLRDNCTT